MINTSSKSVRRFDAIIDRYLYMGVSKEETFHEIVRNRMGDGVLDSCEKEFALIEEKLSVCDKEEKELQEIKQIIIAGKYSLNQERSFSERLDEILKNENKLLNSSKKLTLRLKEIISVASYIKDRAEVESIFETNQKIYAKVTEMALVVQEVVNLLKMRMKD